MITIIYIYCYYNITPNHYEKKLIFIRKIIKNLIIIKKIIRNKKAIKQIKLSYSNHI
jgi:hypothetical protein